MVFCGKTQAVRHGIIPVAELVPVQIKSAAVFKNKIQQAVLTIQQAGLFQKFVITFHVPQGMEQNIVKGNMNFRILKPWNDFIQIDVLDQIIFVLKMIVKSLSACAGMA